MKLAFFKFCLGITVASQLLTAATKEKEIKMASPNSDISKSAPEFDKLTKELLFGDIWKRPGLSQRDKSLITVTVLATLARSEQIDYHLGLAMDNGLTQDELNAALTHIAFYAGWPSAFTGLTHLRDVVEQRKLKK